MKETTKQLLQTMKNNQLQSPNLILGLPVNNKFAVPRLGNVQLSFHFLRRGTNRENVCAESG